MKVTVITPTFNRAELLPRTIESVLAQDFTNFEYLILDDGSVDNTRFVVEPFLTDSRVKYYFHENAGEAETVNWGWGLARGEYFAQVNSDDPVYPNYLKTMVMHMDANPSCIVGYCDFDFIDHNDVVIKKIIGKSWDFVQNISHFSCEAACPGTFLRKSFLFDLKKIKNNKYKFINDVEMYWDLALRGEFVHVPATLTTWRMHPGQISAGRHYSIPECEDWFKRYFSRPDIPEAVKKVKSCVRDSLNSYYYSLLDDVNVLLSEKKKVIAQLKSSYCSQFPEFTCLQVGDTDLIGNKFNGHELHLYLRNQNVNAYHAVCEKLSDDSSTFVLDNRSGDLLLDSIINNKVFAESDVVHLHLMHNTAFDILHIPYLSSLKPLILTIHDPWILGGHCIHHLDCLKWKDHCYDCDYLDVPFKIDNDTSAIEFSKKLFSIQNSNICAIVASSWMMSKVKLSPIWKDKKIFAVPFGVDQSIFKPKDKHEACDKLNIAASSFIILARTQSHFKGIDVIKYAINNIQSSRSIILLTVGQVGMITDLPPNVTHKDYGWLHDDSHLALLYQASDIFLMPSEQESFGMMAIEAMSCGKMVLALTGTALPEVIDSPRCGLAVNKDEYVSELQRLIDNPEEILERGSLSLEYARKEYSKEVFIRRIIDVYRQIMFDFSEAQNSVLLMDQIYKQSFRSEGQICDAYNSKSSSLSCVQRVRFFVTKLREYYFKFKIYYKKNGFKASVHKVITKVLGR